MYIYEKQLWSCVTYILLNIIKGLCIKRSLLVDEKTENTLLIAREYLFTQRCAAIVDAFQKRFKIYTKAKGSYFLNVNY